MDGNSKEPRAVQRAPLKASLAFPALSHDQAQPVQLPSALSAWTWPLLLKAEQLSESQRGLLLRIRGCKCDLARSAEHDKSFLTCSEMGFIWKHGTGSAMVQCQVSALARLQSLSWSTKCHHFCQLLIHGRGSRDRNVPAKLPGDSFSFDWKLACSTRAQQGGLRVLGFCLCGGDLDAQTSQSVCSKPTLTGKSFLNAFLLWIPLWEVCLSLSLLQKLLSVSLINEDIPPTQKEY